MEILPSHRLAGMIMELFDIMKDIQVRRQEGDVTAEYDESLRRLELAKKLMYDMGHALIRNTTVDGQFLYGGYVTNRARIVSNMAGMTDTMKGGLSGFHSTTGVPLLMVHHTRITKQLKIIDSAIQSFPNGSNMHNTANNAREILVTQLQHNDYALDAIAIYLYYLIDLVYFYRKKGGGQLTPLPMEICE